jgi:hypothetical protein
LNDFVVQIWAEVVQEEVGIERHAAIGQRQARRVAGVAADPREQSLAAPRGNRCCGRRQGYEERGDRVNQAPIVLDILVLADAATAAGSSVARQIYWRQRTAAM